MTETGMLLLIVVILATGFIINLTLFIVMIIKLKVIKRMERLDKAMLIEYDELSKRPMDYNE